MPILHDCGGSVGIVPFWGGSALLHVFSILMPCYFCIFVSSTIGMLVKCTILTSSFLPVSKPTSSKRSFWPRDTKTFSSKYAAQVAKTCIMQYRMLQPLVTIVPSCIKAIAKLCLWKCHVHWLYLRRFSCVCYIVRQGVCGIKV